MQGKQLVMTQVDACLVISKTVVIEKGSLGVDLQTH